MDLLLRKLRQRHEISDEEEAVLRGLAADTIDLPPRATLCRRGDLQQVSRLIVGGIVTRQKELANGNRQILELHVAGDFADLHSFTLKRLDHDIVAMTPSQVINTPHERLTVLERTHPRLSHLLWFSTMVDASIHREAMLSLGRRSALGRVAHLFCELFERLRVVELVNGSSFDLPFNQLELSEVAGITPVHVNRTLKALRDEGLVSFRRGKVEIHDHERLKAAADFTDDYLYLGRQPG